MVTYAKITIAGSTVSDFVDYSVSNSSSDNNIVSSFEGDLNNEFGRNKNRFNIGDEIKVYVDSVDPPVNNVFTGILEDVEYHSQGLDDTISLLGKDYSVMMTDSTVQPEVYNNLQAGSIVKDIIYKYASPITTTNVTITGSAIPRITFNQTPVYDAVKQLADMTNMNFYVDNNKDLHFQQLAGSSTGSTFDNTNILYSDFSARRDTVYNQIWVYGDRYLDGYKETFTYSGLVSQGSLVNLLYKPHNTEVTISGGILQPGAIKGISYTTGSNVKYEVAYDDKQIIFTSGTSQGYNIPTSGNSIVINYKRSLPIVKVGDDETSKSQYKLRIKVITDKNIKDPATAEAIMKSELDKYSDPTKEGLIQLKGVTNLNVGENCVVNLPNQGVSNQTYNIVEVNYDINKTTLLNDEVIKIKVNKDLPDLTDTLKDIMLGLRKVQAQEMLDTDLLTRFQFSIGSVSLRQSGVQLWTRSILGEALIFDSATQGILDTNKFYIDALFILGNTLTGILGTSPLGGTFSNWSLVYSGGYP